MGARALTVASSAARRLLNVVATRSASCSCQACNTVAVTSRPVAPSATTRRDGTVQVTYNSHPLYFDNETGESHKPGEVGCQQFNVNGGIWLIMKPNGQPNRSKAKHHHE